MKDVKLLMCVQKLSVNATEIKRRSRVLAFMCDVYKLATQFYVVIYQWDQFGKRIGWATFKSLQFLFLPQAPSSFGIPLMHVHLEAIQVSPLRRWLL